ncbi:MAG TPA: type II toxin-antitoxin system HicB family antitoxin [Phototrophicaceae bacterium]|nr:type II toxin-antitoxin system HicB family antitoxin [Phototrophicaceae bacterium]
MRTVIIYKDPESDAFLAEVPSLPGCHSDGASPEEAAQNVKEAIELTEGYLREIGADVPADVLDLHIMTV